MSPEPVLPPARGMGQFRPVIGWIADVTYGLKQIRCPYRLLAGVSDIRLTETGFEGRAVSTGEWVDLIAHGAEVRG